MLDNLRQALGGGRQRLTRELQESASRRGGKVTLREFIEDTGRALSDVYAAGGFTTLRRAAGLLTGAAPEGEARLADSPTGRRYRDQRVNGPRSHLFVRKHHDEEYRFLGPVEYVDHEGSRPMSIRWRLAVPMPAARVQEYATLNTA